MDSSIIGLRSSKSLGAGHLDLVILFEKLCGGENYYITKYINYQKYTGIINQNEYLNLITELSKYGWKTFTHIDNDYTITNLNIQKFQNNNTQFKGFLSYEFILGSLAGVAGILSTTYILKRFI